MIHPNQPTTATMLPVWRLYTTDYAPMDVGRVAYYVGLMEGNEDAPGLMLVWPDGSGRYKVIDGRHRWLAHVIRGRKLARVVIVGSPE